jgi:superfamily II DNA/RNA helicase
MKLDFFIVRPEEKISVLLYTMEKIVKREKAIVFASTRFHVDYLISVLGDLYECYGVYGKMDMEQRTYNLDSFRKKRSKCILVVTDVAARGLDIPSVKFVIQYDYP